MEDPPKSVTTPLLDKPSSSTTTEEPNTSPENSPIEQVALTVPVTDDPSLPVITFRMWFLGCLSCVIISFLNQFFWFRTEPLTITSVSAQIAVVPLGHLMAAVLPTRPFFKGKRWEFTLNPGPFNVKEHVLITIFANSGAGSVFAIHIVSSVKVFYKETLSFFVAFLVVITTQVMGFGWAGMFRKYLVEPAAMWWPYNLVQVSIFGALHEKEERPKESLTRNQFFLVALICSFAYYALPGYLFPMLTSLSWICWIFPKSVLAHQLGSGLHGLGLGAIGLDWSSISSYLDSPLASPWFATANVAAGFFLFTYVIVPLAYWLDLYNAKRFPIFSEKLFAYSGGEYNITAIVDSNFNIDLEAYEKGGKLYLSTFFVLTYGIGFASLAATVVHVLLFHGREILQISKTTFQEKTMDIHTKLMTKYEQVPEWWFIVTLILNIAAAMFACEYYNDQLQLPWWGVLLACGISIFFTLPIGIITATTNQKPGLNIISEYVIGYLYPGRPVANMCFKVYGFISMKQAVTFLQDFKLGHYMKIPPRTMFMAQLFKRVLFAIIDAMRTLNHCFHSFIPAISGFSATGNLSLALFPSPMEPTSEGNGDIAYLKEKRQHLEERIESQRLIQENLITSLQTLVPDLVSSLDLSLKVLSTFSPPSLSTKPKTPKTPIKPKPPPSPPKTLTPQNPKSTTSRPPPSIRALVSQILIERNPFSPIDSVAILRKLENDRVVVEAGGISAVETALKSIAESTGAVDLEEFMVSGKSSIMVMAIDQNRLLKELPENSQLPENLAGNLDVAGISRPENFPAAFPVGPGIMGPRGGPRVMGLMGAPRVLGPNMNQRPPLGGGMVNQGSKARTEEDDMKDLEALLSKKSFREMQKSKTGEELLDLIHRPTAKETAVAAKFKTKGGPQLKEYCSALTKEDCRRQAGSFIACEKVHFRRIIAPHTDINLGDCSFLDTCRHMKTCKYVHYELDPTPDVPPMMMGAANLPPPKPLKPQRAEYCSEVELGEPQWINCDIRNFRMDILGQFGVIMADPPWDIHMELPYGTMADDEMRNLNVPALQTDGLIFLWVTGRAMELGRECLELWGYKRIEELIWVKTNQLQRIIRTGRTGHWLNHSKEHCLVGIKGNPEVNRNIDTDVIVAEVRETSRKPDEMYPMLERISPRTRKLELFARMHNTHAGWMSLGNQLNGVRLVDEGLRARFKAAYPDVEVQPPSPPRASAMDTTEANVQTRSPFVGLDTKAQSQFPDITPQESYTSEDKSTIPDVEMGG